MNKVTLSVDQRTETGKGPARRLRAVGKAPAIFYGKKTEPIKIAIDVHDFKKAIEQAGSNPLFDLKIRGNEGTTTRRALLKERQIRPVDGSLVHLDFLEVFMDESIEVTVPIEFEGKPVGIDKGGVFQPSTRELRISCLPDNIPQCHHRGRFRIGRGPLCSRRRNPTPGRCFRAPGQGGSGGNGGSSEEGRRRGCSG